MVFIGKNGEEIITITELFQRKKFISAENGYFLFYDNSTNKKETWTFIDNLFMYIPFNTDVEKISEIFSNCGWCKKVDDYINKK